MNTFQRAAAAGLGAVVLFVPTPRLNAAPGNLDTTFGNGGKVTTTIGRNDYGQSMAVQSDGKIVVGGHSSNGSNNDFALVRYHPNGTLDTSFNGTGVAATAIGSGDDSGTSLAIQSDGKIVVGGYSYNGSNKDVAVVRYNPNGTLDTSFNGRGKVTTAVGSGDDSGASVAVQDDGKILVAGSSYNGTNSDFALVRYNTDGTLDLSFNNTGKVTTAVGSANDDGNDLAVQGDGKIVVAGSSDNGSNYYDFALVRYNANGTLDASFNGTGKVTTAIGSFVDIGLSVAVQGDGKIVVAGFSIIAVGSLGDVALVRYNASGTLDTSFNGTGKVITAIGNSHDDGHSVAVQGDGKIVVAGSSHNGSNSDFALIRYNANGSLDTSFGGTGKVTTGVGSSNDDGKAVVVQGDGTIVLAGSSSNGSYNSFAVTRYLSDATPSLSITNVAPCPVPGSNSPQAFTINGTSFSPACTVTLRDLTYARVYPNRTKIVQSLTSITLNPNFSNTTATWSVEVVNPSGPPSGQFQFTVDAQATLTGLSVSGSPNLAAGGSTPLQATATFSNGQPSNVSSQAQWSVSAGPSGTHMSGSTLVAGSGPASTATVTATYAHNTATRTATKTVAIGAGLSVSIGAVTPSYLSGSGNNLTYQLQATATANGGSGNIPASWKLDNTTIAGTSLILNSNTATAPGSHKVSLTVTNGGGLTATATIDVFFPKAPVVNEQFPKVPVSLGHSGTLYAKDAAKPFVIDPARKNNGFVIIIHGMDNRVTTSPVNDWMKEMAEAIQTQLGTQAPNIGLYDWSEDADTAHIPASAIKAATSEFASTVWPPEASFGKKLLSAASVIGVGAGVGLVEGAGASAIAVNLLALRPKGDLHGTGLADYLQREILAGNLNSGAPIHLIGHSAGGFVASNCGKALLADETLRSQLLMPTKLQVTTLDTPFLRFSHILSVRDRGGKFERYVSSYLGELVPGVVILKSYDGLEDFLKGSKSNLQKVSAYFTGNKPAPAFTEAVNYHSGADIDVDGYWHVLDQHADAHEWYTRTIRDPNKYGEGFYYSPFPGGHPFPSDAPAPLPGVAARGGLRGGADDNIIPLSGFSIFGNVAPSIGGYTLAEQGNAGIYKDVTLPANACTVRFRVQFTQPGDGDFIEVSFGDHLSLAVIADGSIVRGGPVEFEVPVVYFGGETGQLLFKLNGLGADNAVAVLDNISITTADDADGDGLTFAQETTLGTDPRYYDTDADGLDDAYETTVTHTSPILADTDADGLTDAAELQAGTNPLSFASRFDSTIIRNADSSVTLTWQAVAGKTYTVIRSQGLDFANFDVVASAVVGTAPQTTWTDSQVPAGEPTGFYVVEVEE